MFRITGILRVVLILVALLAVVVLPVISSGYADLSRAENALLSRDYAAAAASYQLAAWKLPWKAALSEKAAMAMLHADSDAAIALFEQARGRGALSPDGWKSYGAAYWLAGRDQPALEIWLAGLKQYPSYDQFYYVIHLAYRGLGDFPSERIWLAKWLATGKGQAIDHYEMGLLLMSYDPAQARAEFTLAASMEPSSASTVATLQAALVLAGRETNDARRLVILGRALGLVNQWPLAQTMFEPAVSADQQNPEAWAWLGEARQQNGADGKSELDKALALGPNNTLVHALRALYWQRQGEYAAQLAELQRAAQLEPDNAQWLAAIGDAYTETGDLVSALASYQKATTLAPSNATYWRLLALFCDNSGIQVLEVGLPAAKKAAELAPNDPQVLDALGWSYAQAGMLYNAEQTLLKATSMAPDSALAHLHLAETYLRTGDQPSALRELTRVQQLDPGGATGNLAAQIIGQYFP